MKNTKPQGIKCILPDYQRETQSGHFLQESNVC